MIRTKAKGILLAFSRWWRYWEKSYSRCSTWYSSPTRQSTQRVIPDHQRSQNHQRPQGCSPYGRRWPQPRSWTWCWEGPSEVRRISPRRSPRRWAPSSLPQSSLGCRTGCRRRPEGKAGCTCWCWRGLRRCSSRPRPQPQVPRTNYQISQAMRNKNSNPFELPYFLWEWQQSAKSQLILHPCIPNSIQSVIENHTSDVGGNRPDNWATPTVWPDLAKFRHFGKIVTIAGNLLRVHSAIGKFFT